MRGIALYGRQACSSRMSDANLVALDAGETGKQVWKPRCRMGAAARAVHSRRVASSFRAWAVVRRTSSRNASSVAYDANTGKQLWRFHTIATEGDAGKTWGRAQHDVRAAARPGITRAATIRT
jgi:outer membrane protein assembly factor BamB